MTAALMTGFRLASLGPLSRFSAPRAWVGMADARLR